MKVTVLDTRLEPLFAMLVNTVFELLVEVLLVRAATLNYTAVLVMLTKRANVELSNPINP